MNHGEEREESIKTKGGRKSKVETWAHFPKNKTNGKVTIAPKINCPRGNRSGPQTGLKKNEDTKCFHSPDRPQSAPFKKKVDQLNDSLPSLVLIMNRLERGTEKKHVSNTLFPTRGASVS